MDELQQPQLGDECRWCGNPAETTIEIEPGRKVGASGGLKIWREAIMARACTVCADALELAPPKPTQPKAGSEPLFDQDVGREPQQRGGWWHEASAHSVCAGCGRLRLLAADELLCAQCHGEIRAGSR